MKNEKINELLYEVRLMAFGRVNFSEIASENYYKAQKIIKAYNKKLLKNTENELRSALEMLLNVFWIEKNLRVPISRQMHSIGAILHEKYGCMLGFEDGFYYTKCPNMLLHLDFGFSMRGFEKYKCSICDMDSIDCEHRTGQKYNGIECKKFDERCNICCDETSSCNHYLGKIYNDVEAIKITYDMEIITFDMVKEPDFPLARVTKIPFSKQYITENLGGNLSPEVFSYGNTILNCDHCLSCMEYDPTTNEGRWGIP